MAEDFKFPDEIDEVQAIEVEKEPKANIEIEVEDDRPVEDQKNATPLPETIVKEIEEDNLEEYSKEAKQRLLQMKKLINDERRAKEQALREQEEAVRVAQSLLDETKKLKSKLSTGEKVYVDTAKEASTRELEAVKREIKEALEAGDSDKLIEAQEKFMAAKMKNQEIERYKPQYDESALQNDENSVKIPQSQSTPKLDSKTQSWLDKNSWYGVDEDMSFLAMGIHKRLEKDGVPVGSDHYWNAIDTEMHKRFPEKFQSETTETKDSVKKSATVVAPATRSTSPKKIRLTQTQLALAKKFKLSPEQYAMELTKLESQNG